MRDPVFRHVLDLADVVESVMLPADESGQITVSALHGRRGDPLVSCEVLVSRASAHWARTMGIYLLCAAEQLEPTGLEIVRIPDA